MRKNLLKFGSEVFGELDDDKEKLSSIIPLGERS
jgi:hypothetical protein